MFSLSAHIEWSPSSVIWAKPLHSESPPSSIPSSLNGALVEMNNAHTLNRPTDSRAIVLERIGQQVVLPLCYHRTPLSAVGLRLVVLRTPTHPPSNFLTKNTEWLRYLGSHRPHLHQEKEGRRRRRRKKEGREGAGRRERERAVNGTIT